MPQDPYHLHKEMLKDAGAKQVTFGGGHLKYRLPNGRPFILPSTSVSRRGIENSLSWLRKELMQTHPEIANRGRSLSKEKLERIMVVNKPGLPEMPVEVADRFRRDDVDMTITRTIPLSQAHISEVGFWPEPPMCEGHAFQTKTPTPIADFILEAVIKAPKPPIRIEDKEMSSLLERARQALEENKKKLAAYNEQINHLKILQDRELLNQVKLEEYIGRQEAIAKEAEELLGFGVIPPETPPAPPATGRKRKQPAAGHIPFDLVYNTIFPQFREVYNGNGFGPDELRERLSNEGHEFSRKQVANWLGNDVRRTDTALKRISNGVYGFRVNLPEVEDGANFDGHFS